MLTAGGELGAFWRLRSCRGWEERGGVYDRWALELGLSVLFVVGMEDLISSSAALTA